LLKQFARVYPKVSGLAAWSENYDWYIQLSATRCSCIDILWVSLVSFAATTLCVASERVFFAVVYLFMTQSGNFWIHPRVSVVFFDLSAPLHHPVFVISVNWVPMGYTISHHGVQEEFKFFHIQTADMFWKNM
jgi:hypothetical protein